MELLVNGVRRHVKVDSERPLLWVLRNELDLTGAKYGCGEGQCGACTVLIEGVAHRSCITPCGSIAGKEVTTIEGLADGEKLHPVQESFIQADAMHPPFADGSFDYITASLFLHHFQEDEIVELLGSFARIARRAVVINDLVRNLVPYYFIRLISPIFLTSYLTRNDGPVSVLRGFTADELRDLAHRAGIRRYRVERLFPYRFLLLAE